MGKQECKLQPLGICHRLFHFVMNIMSSKAQETVTLGNPVPHFTEVPELNDSSQNTGSHDHSNENPSESSQEPAGTQSNLEDHSSSSFPNSHQKAEKEFHLTDENDSHVSSSPPNIEDKTKNDLDANAQPKTQEDEVQFPSSTVKKAPKKMVSIKESVEDIDSIMKERRKNKGTKKMKSFENGHDDSIKPSRSILKVGSDINDKSDSLNFLDGVRES